MTIVPHLIAETFGSHIGKYSQRLKITHKGQTLAQAPLIHLESVQIISRGVSISTDALECCCERGIPIYFLDSSGTPYASIYSSGLIGTVITRREQLRAYDNERGALLALAFARGKIENQATTLKYLAKTRKETPTGSELRLCAGEVLDFLRALDKLPPLYADDLRSSLIAIEGNAARSYWQAVRTVIPAHYGWTERKGRGAKDAVNSLLNYGYGILYGQVERALVLAGLDPYAGFIHADRPGKPSLTLDFIEEFRQAAVDRVVFGLVNRNFQVEQDEQGHMTATTRKQFAEHILGHLETAVRYEKQRHPLRQVIQMQARQIAAFVRGEREDYEAYSAEW